MNRLEPRNRRTTRNQGNYSASHHSACAWPGNCVASPCKSANKIACQAAGWGLFCVFRLFRGDLFLLACASQNCVVPAVLILRASFDHPVYLLFTSCRLARHPRACRGQAFMRLNCGGLDGCGTALAIESQLPIDGRRRDPHEWHSPRMTRMCLRWLPATCTHSGSGKL